MPVGDFNSFCADHSDEIAELADRFSDYEPFSVQIPFVMGWLKQFQAQHRNLALKLAKRLRYYGTSQIHGLMPRAFEILKEQLNAQTAELNQAIFAPLGRIGESGPDIARRFRNANNLSSRQSQFVELPRLSEAVFKANQPTVVFLDDFVGTGKQVSDAWRDVLSSIVPEFVPMYLLVVAAYSDGIRRVERKTPIKVLHVHLLGGRDQLLSSANQSLSNSEKNAIRNYCEKAGNQPLGFGDLGALVSFAYGTPNNTISVIRGSEKQRPWKGLLPRWEDLH